MSRAALAVTLVATLAGPGWAAAAESGAASQSRTPIEHFVVLMQENHSFDNYFGTYPGADGIPHGTCMPAGRSSPGEGACVRPFRLGGRAVPDLGANGRIHRIQYAGGRMDGFVRAATIDRQTAERSVMGYYDRHDLPFYWKVAAEHVLFDRFFASAADGSVANHLLWLTGTQRGSRIPADGFGDLPTIFDRLEQRGISWKFYVEDYDPRLSFRAKGKANLSAQAVRAPLLNYPRYVRDRRLFSHIVDLEEYYEDLESGRLPHVAYIVPSGASEHPPGRIQAGEKLVRALITALSRSEAWNSSAFMWTYDDWGGWFDHVRPPRVDGAEYGFRVPALLVSPYARRGYVDGTRLETTSILRFIEDNWNLKPLAERDAKANSFIRAFDFSRPPRKPAIIGMAHDGGRRQEAASPAIYLGYAAAVVLSGIFLGWAALGPDRRRRRRSEGEAVGFR
jgi:phospholipase C